MSQKVLLGCENLIENYKSLIQGKRLGIICNHTSKTSSGSHIVHELQKITTVTTLFAPEHGFYGNIEDQATVKDEKKDNINIYSLFGEYTVPTQKMLKDVDLLIYDIQDVGVRFYTFISSLYYAMYSCKRFGIPLIVLDRPNPITAERIAGSISHPSFCGFLGVVPIPIRYGMTVGELAKMFNEETSFGFQLGAELNVIPMVGYKRNMWYSDTKVPWTPTSPCMQTLETTYIYPGTCLFEGTTVNEGRGTDAPFLTIGAPFIEPKKVLDALPKSVLNGVQVEETTFTPIGIEGVCTEPKYKNQKCFGFKFKVLDRDVFEPIQMTITLMSVLKKFYPKEFKVTKFMDQLWGSEDLRSMIEEGSEIKLDYDLELFKKLRKKYIMYK